MDGSKLYVASAKPLWGDSRGPSEPYFGISWSRRLWILQLLSSYLCYKCHYLHYGRSSRSNTSQQQLLKDFNNGYFPCSHFAYPFNQVRAYQSFQLSYEEECMWLGWCGACSLYWVPFRRLSTPQNVCRWTRKLWIKLQGQASMREFLPSPRMYIPIYKQSLLYSRRLCL